MQSEHCGECKPPIPSTGICRCPHVLAHRARRSVIQLSGLCLKRLEPIRQGEQRQGWPLLRKSDGNCDCRTTFAKARWNCEADALVLDRSMRFSEDRNRP